MAITNGYCTADQVERALSATPTPLPSAKSAQIEESIEAASRMIDRFTGRRFWQDGSVQTREFYADDPYTLESLAGAVLDISTTTGLIVKIDDDDDGTFETTLTISTNFILFPLNAADDGWPYTGIRVVDSSYYFPHHGSGRPGVQVTAKFGWAAVPDDIERACIIQAVALYQAPSTWAGGSAFGDGGFIRTRGGLHPTAATLCDPYCLPRVG